MSYLVGGIGYALIGFVVFLAIRSRRSRAKYAESLFSGKKASSSDLTDPGRPPIAKFGFRPIDWVFPFFTGGISLFFSFSLAKKRQAKRQEKINRLWGDYKTWLRRDQEPFKGIGYLFEGGSLVSDSNGVVLEEARQGNVTTTTEGDIRLRGSTGTVGVGGSVGGIGIGVASSESRMSGTLNSKGTSSVGSDVARGIDNGQLIAGTNGLNFIGNLQTRNIPLDDIVNTRRDSNVLLVSAKSLQTTQRFRFKDPFAVRVFEYALSVASQTKDFPNVGTISAELESEAREHVAKSLSSLKQRIQEVTSAA